MTQGALPFFAGETLLPASISPWLEMGAYEALWARQNMSFKKLAQLFRDHPGALPSELAEPGEAAKMAGEVHDLLRRRGVERFGLRIYRADEYPQRLRDARDPVEFLYFQGTWELVETRCVAVIGSRKPSDDGRARARRVARCLVRDGFTVVSGLATGIDTEAHTSAIDAGGRTIAVVGTPLGEYYPPENRELQDSIARDFLLIAASSSRSPCSTPAAASAALEVLGLGGGGRRARSGRRRSASSAGAASAPRSGTWSTSASSVGAAIAPRSSAWSWSWSTSASSAGAASAALECLVLVDVGELGGRGERGARGPCPGRRRRARRAGRARRSSASSWSTSASAAGAASAALEVLGLGGAGRRARRAGRARRSSASSWSMSASSAGATSAALECLVLVDVGELGGRGERGARVPRPGRRRRARPARRARRSRFSAWAAQVGDSAGAAIAARSRAGSWSTSASSAGAVIATLEVLVWSTSASRADRGELASLALVDVGETATSSRPALVDDGGDRGELEITPRPAPWSLRSSTPGPSHPRHRTPASMTVLPPAGGR